MWPLYKLKCSFCAYCCMEVYKACVCEGCNDLRFDFEDGKFTGCHFCSMMQQNLSGPEPDVN